MATIGARLTSTGTLLTAGSFDETVQSTHSVKADGIFADEFDEITLASGTPSGGSVQLNGTTQTINVAGSGDFQFGTENFTVEGWFYLKTVGYTRLWCFPDGDNVEVQGSTLYYWNGGAPAGSGSGVVPQNQWFHVALVKNAGNVVVYLNGVSRITDSSPFNSTTSRALAIGGEVNNTVGGQGAESGTFDGYLDGYFTNFRVVKGTAVYTGTFSTPIAPFTAVTNTKLLLSVVNQATFLSDSSGTSKSVTNTGGAVFNAFTPLSTVYNGAMKQLSTGVLEVADEFDEVTGIV